MENTEPAATDTGISQCLQGYGLTITPGTTPELKMQVQSQNNVMHREHHETFKPIHRVLFVFLFLIGSFRIVSRVIIGFLSA